MPFIIGALVVLVIGAVLFVIRLTDSRKAAAVRATPAARAGETEGLAGRLVEVAGMARCAEPLVSPAANEPCVYYALTVERDYEERYEDTDKEGHPVERTRRRSEVVAERSRHIPFLVEDATGAVLVDPEGASIDATETINRYEAGDAPGNLLAHVLGNYLSNHRTLGYRVRERVLPLDRPVFVLGEVDAGPRIVRPRRWEQPFLISHKSGPELLRVLEGRMFWLLGGMVVCGLLASGLLAAAAMRLGG